MVSIYIASTQSRTQSHRWVALATQDWKTILIGRSISYWTHTPCGVYERGQYEHPISAFDAGWQLEILSSIARPPAGLYYGICRAWIITITKPIILPKWIQVCINQLLNPFTTFPDEKQQTFRQNKQIFRQNKAKYIVFTHMITRLACLTPADSRKSCLRLLGCQPGCTIIYYSFKKCAHFGDLF
jgi:hypothetical protein